MCSRGFQDRGLSLGLVPPPLPLEHVARARGAVRTWMQQRPKGKGGIVGCALRSCGLYIYSVVTFIQWLVFLLAVVCMVLRLHLQTCICLTTAIAIASKRVYWYGKLGDIFRKTHPIFLRAFSSKSSQTMASLAQRCVGPRSFRRSAGMCRHPQLSPQRGGNPQLSPRGGISQTCGVAPRSRRQCEGRTTNPKTPNGCAQLPPRGGCSTLARGSCAAVATSILESECARGGALAPMAPPRTTARAPGPGCPRDGEHRAAPSAQEKPRPQMGKSA